MERGVEHSDLRNVGQQSLDGIHALDVGRIVEGSQVVAGSESLHHFGSESDGLVELLSAVYHAMSYGIQLVETPKDSVFAAGQHFEDVLHALGVFLYGVLHLVLLAIELDGYKRVGQTYFLNAATGDDGLVVHVVKRILY